MKTIDEWLSAYGECHKNSTNKMIHFICVPVIEFSVLGILWLIPTPVAFWSIPYLNWATLTCLMMLIFYLSLNSMRYFVGSFVMILIILSAINFLQLHFGGIIIYGLLLLFVTSWIAQFIGHKIEGKKPAFFQDLLFLLIGPLWILKSLYNKIGLI